MPQLLYQPLRCYAIISPMKERSWISIGLPGTLFVALWALVLLTVYHALQWRDLQDSSRQVSRERQYAEQTEGADSFSRAFA